MPFKTCSTCGTPYSPTSKSQTKCEAHGGGGRASRSPTTQAQNAEYRRERKRILTGSPTCALQIVCDGAPATTADHIIPVSKGGGHVGNLQPACAACNAAKGDRVVQALRSHRPRRYPSTTRAEFARQVAGAAGVEPLKVFIPPRLS